MVYFQTKNPNLGKFLRVLQGKMLEYLIDIWSISQPFGIFCDNLVYFYPFWYAVPRKNLAILPCSQKYEELSHSSL
jgi:hypothetical protein